jgi:hypothetical protein
MDAGTNVVPMNRCTRPLLYWIRNGEKSNFTSMLGSVALLRNADATTPGPAPLAAASPAPNNSAQRQSAAATSRRTGEAMATRHDVCAVAATNE